MFKHYNGFLATCRRLRKIRPDDVEQTFKELFDITEQPGAKILIIEESMHYLLGHHVVYVSSPLAEQFMLTSFGPGIIKNLKTPFTYFEICIEEGLKTPSGELVPPMLVSLPHDDAHIKAMTHFFKKYSNEGSSDWTLPKVVEDYIRNSMIITAYTSTGIERVNIADAHIEGNIEKRVTELDVKNASKDLLSSIARIALGVICYLNTQNPDVQPHNDFSRPRYARRINSIILGKDVQRDEFFIIRKAHWRYLRDERYKRDEDGNVRMLWIRPANVHYGKKTKEQDPDITRLGDQQCPQESTPNE